jgi:septal ring factor EnvC (AmiA/AmiB activator)
MLRQLTCVIPLLGLCGCVVSNCDPNTAEFFSGIACEASGTYGAHEQVQRQTLNSARKDLATQRANAAAAAEDAAAAQNRVAMLRGQLSAMQQDDARLRRRLDMAEARDAGARDRIRELRRQLDTHRDDVQRASAHPDPAEVEALERRRQQIIDAASAM